MSSAETPTGNLFLNDFADVATFKDTVCANVMKLIRSSNDLSRASDHDFLMSFAPLRQRMDRMAENLLKNANQLLTQVNIHRSFGLASWKEADHDDKLEQLIDINDILFERISSSLDEAAGLKKQSEVKTLVPSIRNVPATWSKTDGFVLQETVPSYKQSMQQQHQQANKRTSNLFAFNHQQSKNIPKPQLKFTDKVNNNPQIPFVPKIRTKPNAQTPLPTIFGILDSQTIDSTLFEKHPELLSNPYFDEIEAFQPSDDLLRPVEPQLPQPIDQTKCSFVDTPEKLRTMIEHIEMQSELAIDLEHHSFRSYQGFTCLMQISSRTEDFLVDTIALRDHLTILNEIFTNPNVVKVLHGADSDVEWLQKDFGLYIVNMFDTHQAARELNLPSFSLAYLLKSYCDIDANKQYQLADWRIRPLPEELLNYAREDTHYLLYIYDLLRNRLLQLRNNDAELIQNVYQKSKMLCQKVYRKAPFDENAYEQSYRKSRKIFNVRQLAALKSLYYWRDRIARQEDESIGYVLPNHMLLQIAEILPREAQGVRACCNPVPLLVQHNLHDIHQLILKVRDIPLIEEPREQNAVPLTLPMLYDPENVLYCPHDTSHQIEQQYPSETTKKVPHPNDLSSILDQIFLDESKQREEHLQSNTLIQLKTELLPTTKPRATKSLNAFDPYMPESYRTGLPIENKSIWKVYYPDRDPSRKVHLNETNHQNGSTISKEKLTDDIEMIMLKKQNGKRKRKGTADENSNAKMKNKRYRRGCVADEVPSTIILDNDEEAGEIPDEPSPNIRPFDYEAIEEEKILSNKKFKRPADDEEIYDPNRSKKSSTVKTPKRPGAQQTHKSLTYPFPKKP